MPKARIAVMVSGGGTNLQALIDAQGTVIKSGEIALVVSNKAGVYALERAEKAGIKHVTVLKKDFPTQADFEAEILRILKENRIDMIVLAGFLAILGTTIISEYKDRIINVHPSLIPGFCGEGYYGLKVHEEALKYGVKITGATVHYVNEVPDGGKIIFQKAVEIKDDDTPETLQKRVMEQAEWQLLPKACELVCKEICK